MTIKFTQETFQGNETYAAGDIINVPESVAKRLIGGKVAVEATQEEAAELAPAETPEAKTVKAETASVVRGHKKAAPAKTEK